jgi:hypothetical protein
MRGAMEGARRAGAALVELKRRVGRGNWQDWLRDNFEMSPQTARLYMRIALRWDEIVEHGLDRAPDLALSDLRYFLSNRKSNGEEKKEDTPEGAPPEEETDDVQDVSETETEEMEPGADDAAVHDCEAEDSARPAEIHQYPVLLSVDEAEEFEHEARSLMRVFGVPTESDAIRRAVRTCYEEHCRG